MTPDQRRNIEIFAMPLEQQREALLPVYLEIYSQYAVDWQKNTELFHDDYVFEGRGSIVFPGLPQRIEGRDGYIDGQQQLNEVVQMERVEIDDLIPLGGGRVVLLTRFVMTTGGVQVEQQALELHEFCDGLLHRHHYWFLRDEGRWDLGL